MDLLCDYHRPARLPLEQWASILLRHLAPAIDGEPDYRTIASVANATALIEAHSGSSGRARQLCEDEISWVSRIARHRGRQYLALAVQPWINLGRLRRMTGHPDGGISHFALLDTILSGQALHLGPCVIKTDDWEQMQDIEPGIMNVIRAVYVVDTIKSYLHARAHENVLDQFSSDQADLSSGTRTLVREAHLISAAALGLHERCLYLDSQLAACDVYEDAVMNLHTIESKKVLGYIDEAQAAAVLLAASFQARVFDQVAPTAVLRFASTLAYELDRLGLPDFAAAVSIRELEIANAVNDEVSRWHSLRTLLRLCPSSPNRQNWQDELDSMTAGSGYAVIQASAPNGSSSRGSDAGKNRACLFRTVSAIFAR